MNRIIILLIAIVFATSCQKGKDFLLTPNNVPTEVAENLNRLESSCGSLLHNKTLQKMDEAFKRSKKQTLKLESIYTSSGGGNAYSSVPPAVFYIEFNGAVVENSIWNWNNNQPVTCPASELSDSAKKKIIQIISERYVLFNIVITNDITVYNSAPADRRHKHIVTRGMQMNGYFSPAAGYAFPQSYLWHDETVSFSFNDWLGNNINNIAEATAHELGHTVGLNHQAQWNGETMISPYRANEGNGAITRGHTEGTGYNATVSWWTNGRSETGEEQDDVKVIASVLGFKGDPNAGYQTGKPINYSNQKGILFPNETVDRFILTLDASRKAKIGIVSNGSIDTRVVVMNGIGQIMQIIDNVDDLNGATVEVSFNTPLARIEVIRSTNDSPLPANIGGGYTLLVSK